ncbi:hypothetical protein VYU27_004682 [Nannochloropsis oceanica]
MTPSTTRRVNAITLPQYATFTLGFLSLVALLSWMCPQFISQAHAATAFVGGAGSGSFGSRISRGTRRTQGQTTMLASARRSRSTRPLPYPVRFAVLGGGSFGLALASVLGKKSIPVTILVRKEDVAEHINLHHRHPTYLSDISLAPTIRATTIPEEALNDASFIIHAVPVQYSRKFLEDIAPHVPKNTPIISTSKGIETGTLCMMQDILLETLGPNRETAYLSGPSFAREIALGLVTAVVAASESEALANEICDIMGCNYFRVFTSTDVVGVEVGGAVKNVIAIAAGMCEGLGLGTNAMAALVTRGCNEMQRLALSLGARPTTLTGLSGVGDTFGTCFGPLSRNRNLGVRLGKGEKLEDILGSSTEVAEGHATAFSLVQLIEKTNRAYRRELEFPIIYGVKEILEGKRTPAEGLRDLMAMPVRVEMWNL